ncbi:MAG: tetratricopeptide repeat protein [Betaproteobacteria bacterium]
MPPRPSIFRFAVAVALTLPSAFPAFRDARAQAAAPAAAQSAVPAELSEEARKAYQQGLKDARESIARKQYPAATARLDGLLLLRPREPQARFLKGVVETESGDADAAIATFRSLTEDFPELPEPYNNLAVLYAQKGNWDGARIALQTALTTAPDWAVAHENLGDVFVRLAAIHYDRAATLDRDNKAAAAKLALARDLLVPRPAAAAPAKP